MKNKTVKKLVGLLTLVCIMLSFSVLPVQAATEATEATINSEWTENTAMRTKTSTHLEVLKASAIASVLAGKLGGVAAEYLPTATMLLGSATILDSQNVYIYRQFYWQYSGDPYTPYYIKNVNKYYEDPGFTKLVDTQTRYYYSYAPYSIED